MGKLLTSINAVVSIAVWFLLFVILDVPLGTAFIAGGCVLAGGLLAGVMAAGTPARVILDARLTSAGLLLGITAFAVLEVVLSVPMWVGVITGLAVIGLDGIIEAAVRTISTASAEAEDHQSPVERMFHSAPSAPSGSHGNGHGATNRDPVGAR